MSSFLRTGQLAAADRQESYLYDDMFGFDIRNDDDREYLAEVARNGIGHEDDINEFICLGHRRGLEEWQQAMSCAEAMRDRASFDNPLDARGVLTFLAKIYRVKPGPYYPVDLQSPLHIPGSPNAKRKALDTEIALEKPAKKEKRAKKGTDSPYWKESSEDDDQSGNDPEAKVTSKKKASKKSKGSSEGMNSGATLACENPELASALLNDERKSVRSASSVDTKGLIRQRKDVITGETPEDTSEPEPDTPTIQDLNEVQSNIKSKRTGELADIAETQALSDNEQKQSAQKATPKRKAKSPYFETAAAPSPKLSPSKSSPNKRPPRGTVSALPFPTLDSPSFGLIQEELADDPFRLLIAVTFLIRTSGKAAIPVFRALMERYPTPADLADADTADIVAMIKHLGLGVVRATAIQKYARTWLDSPPQNGVRYPVKGYLPTPTEGDHGDGDSDLSSSSSSSTQGWEIAHLTQGPYALDSWRIFCRDVLRGEAEDWKGAGREGEFQPEWMRVLPADKELRACLRWMWMKEGWEWDPATGEKTVLSDELFRAVQDGRVGYDDLGNLRIVDEKAVVAEDC